MTDRPLRPAIDHRLGGLLPRQLANRPSAALSATGHCWSPPFLLRDYAVLAHLSMRYPPLKGTFRCITHPFAARRQPEGRAAARLACVKHAASVQSEPGSNSFVLIRDFLSLSLSAETLCAEAHSLDVDNNSGSDKATTKTISINFSIFGFPFDF